MATDRLIKSARPSAASCQVNGHDISRSFTDCKKGVVEADCWCWTCVYHWIERWTLERVEEEE